MCSAICPGCAPIWRPGQRRCSAYGRRRLRGEVLGKPIDVIAADHQSKADIGAAIARQWFDADNVDMAIGFDNSSIALAVEQVAFQKNRIAIAGAVSTTVFTGKNCTPNEAAWLHDNYALANTLRLQVAPILLGP